MKRPIAIAIILAVVVALLSLAVVVYQLRQQRKRERMQKIAKALKEYSTGDGWKHPPHLDSATQHVDTASVETNTNE